MKTVFALTLFAFFFLATASHSASFTPGWDHFNNGAPFEKSWETLDKETLKAANNLLSGLEEKENVRVEIVLANPADFEKESENITAEAVRICREQNQRAWYVLLLLKKNGSAASGRSLDWYSSSDHLLPVTEKEVLNSNFSGISNLNNGLLPFLSNVVKSLEKRPDRNGFEKFFDRHTGVLFFIMRIVAYVLIVAITLGGLGVLLYALLRGLKLNPVLLIPLAVIIPLHLLHILPPKVAIVCYLLYPICILGWMFGRRVK